MSRAQAATITLNSPARRSSMPGMFDPLAFLAALPALALLVLAGWGLALALGRVDIVDAMWSLMFLVAGAVYVLGDGEPTPRGWLVLTLLAAWALRLSVYLAIRCLAHEEDPRYAAMRRRYGPGFDRASLWRIFGFQALLAWLVSLPLAGAAQGEAALGLLDALAVGLWLTGFLFESIGDRQLARFRADPANADKVMDQGLWRYTRHPNYFGDCGVWWAFFLFALAAAGWWSFPGPLLMTWLLLRVSGVALLERSIGKRRPGYAEYARRTSAVLPWFPRAP